MKKIFFIVLSFLILPGCLTFHKISYEINLETELKGNGIIKVFDIRSDAETKNDFEEDKNIIFEYLRKSNQFMDEMKNEGKEISLRRLFIEDNLLNAEVKFSFNDIHQVEGIAFEDGYYYITMDSKDNIISTNGEIIISGDIKRIIWDKSIKTLLFEMMAVDYKEGSYKELAPYYKGEVE
jgi:hypothetical protein